MTMSAPMEPQANEAIEVNDDQNEACDSTEQSGTKEKKKYVRQMTEKRREQNRRAQKVYRERMKRKLEDLEQQGQSERRNYTRLEKDTSFEDDDEEVIEQVLYSSSFPDPMNNTTKFDFNDIFAAAGDLVVPTTSFELSIAPSPQPQPSQVPMGESIASSSTSFTNPSRSLGSSSTTSMSSPPQIMSPEDTSLDHLPMHGLWTMPYRPKDKKYIPPPTSPSVTQDTLRALSHYTPDLLGEEHNTLVQDITKRLEQRLYISNSHHSPSSSSTKSLLPQPNTLPSPWLNHISRPQDLSLSAHISIAISLGVTRLAYLNDHPSPFPSYLPPPTSTKASSMGFQEYLASSHDVPNSSTTTSNLDLSTPFYTPQEIATAFAHIKPELRPTNPQLIHPHPGYLDTIVFPQIRERAVLASSRGELDHMELFLDLMHGGLVCWGGSMPDGRRESGGGGGLRVYHHGGAEGVERGGQQSWARKRRRTSAATGSSGGIGVGFDGRRMRDMRDCVAWSQHSWEARRWFLKKWSWLVGTEEEERRNWREGDGIGIWEGSRFWWRLRGEEWGVEEDDDFGEVQEDDVDGGVGGQEGERSNIEMDQDRRWVQGDFDPEVMNVGAATFRWLLAGDRKMGM